MIQLPNNYLEIPYITEIYVNLEVLAYNLLYNGQIQMKGETIIWLGHKFLQSMLEGR